MDTSLRTHAFMFAVMALPPLGSLYLGPDATKGSSNLYLYHAAILLVWTAAIKKIVYNHYFGPLRSIPMAPGDWLIFGHTPYMYRAIPGNWILDFVNKRNARDYGMIRTKGILHLSDTVILTDPDLFNEVLSAHCYDCECHFMYYYPIYMHFN